MAKRKKRVKLRRKLLKALVVDRRLDPVERMSNRLGYMGSAFLMISPYLLPYDNIGAYTYLVGAILSVPQTITLKAWNIFIINLNLLVGYGVYICKAMMG
jgi:hypothetical protein